MSRVASRFCSAAAGAVIALLVPSLAFAQPDDPRPRSNAAAPRTDRPAGRTRPKAPAPRLRIGPLVGLGFPRPFSVEAFAKIGAFVGVGAEYSFLPRTSIAGGEGSFKGVAADLRVFPFRGAFFIGARAGRQWLDANATITAEPLGSFNESMAASTWFVNPRLGFLFTFESGVTVGVDVGVQLPVSPSYERQGRATAAGLAAGTSVDRTLASIAGALGNSTTPTIDILRLGFLF